MDTPTTFNDPKYVDSKILSDRTQIVLVEYKYGEDKDNKETLFGIRAENKDTTIYFPPADITKSTRARVTAIFDAIDKYTKMDTICLVAEKTSIETPTIDRIMKEHNIKPTIELKLSFEFKDSKKALDSLRKMIDDGSFSIAKLESVLAKMPENGPKGWVDYQRAKILTYVATNHRELFQAIFIATEDKLVAVS